MRLLLYKVFRLPLHTCTAVYSTGLRCNYSIVLWMWFKTWLDYFFYELQLNFKMHWLHVSECLETYKYILYCQESIMWILNNGYLLSQDLYQAFKWRRVFLKFFAFTSLSKIWMVQLVVKSFFFCSFLISKSDLSSSGQEYAVQPSLHGQ